jgi:hypothetical protein
MAVLSLAALLFTGCGGDRSVPTDDGTLLAPPAGSPSTQDFDPEQLEYEEFSGVLMGGQGGVMFEYSVTWGKNCLFALIVPPEATDPYWGTIPFTFRIPTKDSYMLYPELHNQLFIRLGPDGTHFLAPITVVATWMPWEGTPPDPLEFWNGGDYGTPTVEPVGKRWRITFQVDHFSDWRVGPRPPKTGEENDVASPITW